MALVSMTRSHRSLAGKDVRSHREVEVDRVATILGVPGHGGGKIAAGSRAGQKIRIGEESRITRDGKMVYWVIVIVRIR